MRSLRDLYRRDRQWRPPLARGTATRVVTIRPALSDDALALRRLAALDSAELPTGALLVAEVSGELWAAVAVASDVAVADPFRPSAELVRLLHLRAAQLRRSDERPVDRAGRGRLVPWWGGAFRRSDPSMRP